MLQTIYFYLFLTVLKKYYKIFFIKKNLNYQSLCKSELLFKRISSTDHDRPGLNSGLSSSLPQFSSISKNSLKR